MTILNLTYTYAAADELPSYKKELEMSSCTVLVLVQLSVQSILNGFYLEHFLTGKQAFSSKGAFTYAVFSLFKWNSLCAVL